MSLNVENGTGVGELWAIIGRRGEYRASNEGPVGNLGGWSVGYRCTSSMAKSS